MRFHFKDQVIIITGASSGIGAELARVSARKGAKVVLAARSKEKLDAIVAQIKSEGGVALAVPTDVTKQAEVENLMATTLQTWGRIDVLVNNAGYGLWSRFVDMPLPVMRENFETNVFASLACIHAVLPQFEKQKRGYVVNVESIVGLRSMPMSSCYSASKHALHAFSEALRIELAPAGIHVLSVCPGLITTNFHENRVQIGDKVDTGPKWLYMPADKCVQKIVGAMEKRKRQVVVTGHAKLIAFCQRVSPRFVDFVFSRMKS